MRVGRYNFTPGPQSAVCSPWSAFYTDRYFKQEFFLWTSFSLLFLTIPGDTDILYLADYLTLSPLEIAYKKIHKKINIISVKILRKNNKVKQQNCVHRF